MWDTQGDFTIDKESITYGSVHDGDAVKFRICCKCFDSLVDSCVINPIIDKDEISFG